MGIVVEKPGILTTVQDAGRFGYQQYGVSPAGPMDTRSFQLANILTGNRPDEGALEFTVAGPSLRFEQDNVIAVTGGDLSPSLDGRPVPMYQAVAVKEGETLSFGMAHGNGCRGYIAFAGGLDIPLVMGSKSTLMRNKMGGMDGRKLEPEKFLQGEITLRVVTGPQEDAFSQEELRRFFWYGAEITNEFDRMGCRLKRKEPIRHLKDGNIISDGIALGSIQVPTNGQPIIMLADRQSTGGYAKIGTVISVDLPLLAQSLPGTRVRFIRVSLELAQELYVRQKKQIEAFQVFLEQTSDQR